MQIFSKLGIQKIDIKGTTNKIRFLYKIVLIIALCLFIVNSQQISNQNKQDGEQK